MAEKYEENSSKLDVSFHDQNIYSFKATQNIIKPVYRKSFFSNTHPHSPQ